MKLYVLSNSYISNMTKIDSRVLDNTHGVKKRPYIGALITLGGFDYFLPLASPDPTDYENNTVRKTTMTIIRLFENSNFLGKVLINNMLPVPPHERTLLSTTKHSLQGLTGQALKEAISDNAYIDIVNKEIIAIKQNIKKIIKNANIVYNQKKNENVSSFWNGKKKPNYLSATVDFSLLEVEYHRLYT